MKEVQPAVVDRPFSAGGFQRAMVKAEYATYFRFLFAAQAFIEATA